MLSDVEKYRYNRHLILDKVGVEGQNRLKKAKVLVVGAGGLGCPVLQYLAAAGVGTIGIVDFDIVDESNLQRQILFDINDIGQPKAEAAALKLKKLNPYISINSYNEKLHPQNAISIISNYDVVVDGSDNFSTRYLVNDACVITNKPLIYGSIFKFEGQVSVFNYKGSGSYRCLFPEPPTPGSIPNCSEIGVIGVLPGIIGTFQANETLKIILNIGTPLVNKLLIYNALSNECSIIQYSKNEEIFAQTLELKGNLQSFDYEHFCGTKLQYGKNVDETFLNDLPPNTFVIDVREKHEKPQLNINGKLLHIPLKELESKIKNLNKNYHYVLVCQSGIRSRNAIDILHKHRFLNLYNLEDGVRGIKNKKLIKDA